MTAFITVCPPAARLAAASISASPSGDVPGARKLLAVYVDAGSEAAKNALLVAFSQAVAEAFEPGKKAGTRRLKEVLAGASPQIIFARKYSTETLALLVASWALKQHA